VIYLSKLNERKDLIKVTSVVPLFPVGFSRTPIPPIPELHEQLSRPIIELKLENGERLRLMGIPYDIALEIWMTLKNKGRPKTRRDPRLSVSELLCEIADVEYIAISDIIPDLGVYVADVYLKIKKGSNNSEEDTRIEFKMIPSHAILLALLSGAEIYVSKKLIQSELGESEEETIEQDMEDIMYW